MFTTLMMGLAGAAVVDAVVNDVRSFRIPNRVPVLLILSWAAAAASDPAAMAWGSHLAAGGIAFAAGALLFAAGLWGGGDAKMLPGLALWVGLVDLPRFLLVMALAGALLALFALAARAMLGTRPGCVCNWGRAMAESGHIPYGLAMAAGVADWFVTHS